MEGLTVPDQCVYDLKVSSNKKTGMRSEGIRFYSKLASQTLPQSTLTRLSYIIYPVLPAFSMVLKVLFYNRTRTGRQVRLQVTSISRCIGSKLSASEEFK